jgi:peroxiredoxin
MSLKAQLEACRREYEANAEPHVVDAARRWMQGIAETGLLANAIKAGEPAPFFRLRCRGGGFISLSDLLGRGPVVISFFWGEWCPFCVLALKALAAAHAQIERLGATLIALSQEPRDSSFSRGEGDGEPPFPVLQDPGCKIGSRYRIAFTVPQQLRAAYWALGYPNAAPPGAKGWLLPIPATYVLDSAGLVVLSYLDADYTTRLEPAEIIVALTHLRATSIPNRNNR